MENAIIERIKRLCESKGLTVRSFANKIDFNYSTLNNYITGRRKSVDVDLLTKTISSFDDISPEWLITGKGEMLKRDNTSSISTVGNDQTVVVGTGNVLKNTSVSEKKASGNNTSLKAELAMIKNENEFLKQKIEWLEKTVKDKELIINIMNKTI